MLPPECLSLAAQAIPRSLDLLIHLRKASITPLPATGAKPFQLATTGTAPIPMACVSA